MILAVVGSRDITDYDLVKNVLDILEFDEIVSGGAIGVDSLAKRYAIENNIPIKVFLPDWNSYGKQAGFIRNIDIVSYCDKLVSFWNGKSPGTKHSIDIAIKQGKFLENYMRK